MISKKNWSKDSQEEEEEYRNQVHLLQIEQGLFEKNKETLLRLKSVDAEIVQRYNQMLFQIPFDLKTK